MTDPPKTPHDKFLWLAPFAPPKGHKSVPEGGMCLCVFLFAIKGDKVLLGKYRDDPAWERLTGMDTGRVKANLHGLTLPASHLKFGEDPLEAAKRIGEEVLMLPKGLNYQESGVQTFFYEPTIAPGKMHFDVLFFYDVVLSRDFEIHLPHWYASLDWLDVGDLTEQKFARQHGDVVYAWLNKKAKA